MDRSSSKNEKQIKDSEMSELAAKGLAALKRAVKKALKENTALDRAKARRAKKAA